MNWALTALADLERETLEWARETAGPHVFDPSTAPRGGEMPLRECERRYKTPHAQVGLSIEKEPHHPFG
jgi:hypothetical protein